MNNKPNSFVLRQTDPHIRVIVPTQQAERLSGINFRENCRCAGNFRRWRCVKDVIQDPQIFGQFQADVLESIEDTLRSERIKSSRSTTFHTKDWIGWASTVPISQLPAGVATEKFQPNKRTSAKKVVDPLIKAPKTHEVTIFYRTEINPNGSVIVFIGSLYPGQAVKLDSGNIHPETAVFFAWSQPGA